jgi:hypothetical protein
MGDAGRADGRRPGWCHTRRKTGLVRRPSVRDVLRRAAELVGGVLRSSVPVVGRNRLEWRCGFATAGDRTQDKPSDDDRGPGDVGPPLAFRPPVSCRRKPAAVCLADGLIGHLSGPDPPLAQALVGRGYTPGLRRRMGAAGRGAPQVPYRPGRACPPALPGPVRPPQPFLEETHVRHRSRSADPRRTDRVFVAWDEEAAPTQCARPS